MNTQARLSAWLTVSRNSFTPVAVEFIRNLLALPCQFVAIDRSCREPMGTERKGNETFQTISQIIVPLFKAKLKGRLINPSAVF